MKIGSLDLGPHPLFLAPMEDVTDISFRGLCKAHGADVVYTEFVNADGITHEAQRTLAKMTLREEERPAAIQLYGEDEASLLQAAEVALRYRPDFLDLNFGCPVRKIAGRGAGAGMLRDVPKLLRITEAIVKHVPVPVTVKTRLGWDSESIIIHDLALALQDVGIAALTIHGRTRAQLYTGQADWAHIGQVCHDPQITIPIIGNGDIHDGPSAAKAFNVYGASGVMIGRATYGHPWLFQEIKHFLTLGEEAPPLGIAERVAIAKQHLQLAIAAKGEKRGILELRRHLIAYFKGLPHFKSYRLALVTTLDPRALDDMLSKIGEVYADFVPSKEISASPWENAQPAPHDAPHELP